jgi:hypothetical protein
MLACRYTPDVCQFAISNGRGEDPIVLECPICGFDSARGEADDQNPVSLRYKSGDSVQFDQPLDAQLNGAGLQIGPQKS